MATNQCVRCGGSMYAPDTPRMCQSCRQITAPFDPVAAALSDKEARALQALRTGIIEMWDDSFKWEGER